MVTQPALKIGIKAGPIVAEQESQFLALLDSSEHQVEAQRIIALQRQLIETTEAIQKLEQVQKQRDEISNALWNAWHQWNKMRCDLLRGFMLQHGLARCTNQDCGRPVKACQRHLILIKWEQLVGPTRDEAEMETNYELHRVCNICLKKRNFPFQRGGTKVLKVRETGKSGTPYEYYSPGKKQWIAFGGIKEEDWFGHLLRLGHYDEYLESLAGKIPPEWKMPPAFLKSWQ